MAYNARTAGTGEDPSTWGDASGERKEGRSVWGGYTNTEVDYQIPRSWGHQGYDPDLGIPKGYTDRRSWLYKESAPLRAQQAAQLDNLRAYATGERSMAREQAARERDRQAAAYSSLAANAQRGGRSMAARQTSAYQAEQGARDIGAQSRIAQQLERQQAARAYMGAADTALKSQMGLEKLGRGYGQMGVQDKERWNAYKRGLDALYGQKKALAMGRKLDESAERGAYISAGIGAVSGGVGALGQMSDRDVKRDVADGEQVVAEFLRALAESRR